MLRAIRKHAPTAIIGGGAARDLYFNKPFRDVDIFINAREVSGRGQGKFPGNIFFEEVIPEILCLRLGCEDSYEAQMNYFSSNIGHLYDCHMELGNFQFIGTKVSTAAAVKQSDFGLNCIYHNGTKLTTFPAFDDAIQKKELSPNPGGSATRYSSQFWLRMASLNKKYPDFVIPENWRKEMSKPQSDLVDWYTAVVNDQWVRGLRPAHQIDVGVPQPAEEQRVFNPEARNPVNPEPLLIRMEEPVPPPRRRRNRIFGR